MNDCDVQDLDFINGETELLGYMNEAIDDAESIVHTLGLEAKYFLIPGTIALVNGTSDYSLPSDIFASKIVQVFYVNGNTKYEVFRIRDLKSTPFFQAGDDYQYLPITTTGTANNMRVRLYPTPAENGTYIQLFYIRNATVMTTSTAATNVCEIPESQNFVMAHCRYRIFEKMGNPLIAEAKEQLIAQKALMIETLQEQVPDENTLAMQDMSFYEDQLLGRRIY